jgi:Uma2 family endonuclease
MKHETLAPWAEAVPGAPFPMAPDDLLNLQADDWRYELVDGRLVRMGPTGLQHLNVTRRLYRALDRCAEDRHAGLVTLPDAGFRFGVSSGPDTVLSPDIALIGAEKVRQLPAPDSPEYERFLAVIPDLVIEVAAPDQYRPEMIKKAQLYLELGVPLVWIIWPKSKQVDVWSPGSDVPMSTLDAGDMLDGLNILPGFTYPVADLFA